MRANGSPTPEDRTAPADSGRPRPLARLPTLPLPARLPRLLPELVLLPAVNAVYKYGRKVANGHTTAAYHHADGVWSFERGVHLPSERSLQQLMLHWEWVIDVANYLYATVHFPAMVIFLAYMFARHRAHYLWIRRAIVVQTLLALLGHLLFPLAPPRLLPGDGMVDTAAVYGPAVYGRPDGDSTANQFAAMPSLHVGWALAIAVGLIAATRSRHRWLWLLHPLATLMVVVGTANHYWLDGVVGSLLLAVALAVVPGPDPAHAQAPTTHWAWPLRRGPRSA
ncbi:phosphatase PAP2 family protein [Actinacidiphila rubida]|uniref:PAP2 superfamily protein n=1 Tax=Actinacidiphila rubida TaxID=310780 RepID=A0A1H8TH86_9ACTN|nr:phosphatase PAP2 family protein [Actinacidiphila rubida]SEO90175.1 PAP2 superfamily protein [Actinacidiphila rubida]